MIHTRDQSGPPRCRGFLRGIASSEILCHRAGSLWHKIAGASITGEALYQ